MQVKRMLRATGVVVVAGLSYGTAAYADSVIVGQVVSADSKKPVGDVVITATSPNLQGEQVVVTDAQGQYRIPQLPPGVYTLRFDKESFKPFSRSEVQLRLDRTIRVNVELLPENFSEVIEVTARPPTIDVGSTSTGVNVDQEFIKRIAVNRPGGKGGAARSFDSLAELAPGAQNDSYGVSINGTTSPENGYVVDGLSTNDPAFGINASPLSVEFVQDVNIITGGYMPEYGRSTGGVINAVTKSGSNEFHGTIFGSVTPGPLGGTPATVVNDGSVVTGVSALDVLGDVGATLGGPIIKDKLWFFAGVSPSFSRYTHTRGVNRILTDVVTQTDPDTGEVSQVAVPRTDPVTGLTMTEPIPGSSRDYLGTARSLQYMGKLTYLLNQDHNVSLSVTGTPSVSGGGSARALAIDPQTGRLPTRLNGKPESFGTIQEISGTTALALKYAGAFADKKFLLDANVGWFHQTAATLPSDGSRPGDPTGLAALSEITYRAPRSIGYFERYDNIDALCNEGAADTVPGSVACPAFNYTAGGYSAISDGKLDRVQVNTKGTYLLSLLGNHVLKAGADVELLSYDQLKAFPGGVRLRESLTGGSWQDYRRYGYQTGPDTAFGTPTQQSLSTSTTAGGFLQDSWTIASRVTLNVGVRYDTQWLYGGDRNLAFVLGNQVSPRVGVIVDPLANGRMKVFANFARYYEQVPINLLDRNFPSESRYQASRKAGVGACDPAILDTPAGHDQCVQDSTVLQTKDDYGLDPSFRFSGGKSDKEPVDPNIQAQSSDEYLVGAEYELFANIRAGASYTHRNMNSVIEDMSNDDGNTYFLGNPGQGFASAFPKATRNYDAVTVFLNRTFADGWLAQASYTWSKLFGNYPGLFRPENEQLDPNILSDFDLRSLLVNREGLLPYDRTHSVKVFGAKEFNFSKDLTASIGLSYRGNSGSPVSYIGAHPTYGTSEAFILQRGTAGRSPWVHNIDSNVGVNYRVTKSNVVSVTLDVFNIFNFQEATLLDNNYTFASVRPVTDKSVTPDNLKPEHVTKINEDTLQDEGTLTDDDLNKNFKKPTQYQTPRQIRFGIKYTF
ncbi:TonB-dependent receptor [Archangium violaceum]|uniref:TonB-dependent receptor domain-containing protein n=1 Tax=Archangium violaceum TaxID=83451 RepID=UPI00195175E4|nr:TonB-dependent receptor [Archangium violaceum]QRN95262.1 TonB-dependent receptor [Archangium violaceum]